MKAQLPSWVCTTVVLLGLSLLARGARPVNAEENDAKVVSRL